MNAAKAIRLEKERHPERFCSVKGCLWRVRHEYHSDTPCRKHGRKIEQSAAERLLHPDCLKEAGISIETDNA